MKFFAAALSATLAALVGNTVAQLQVTSPGGPNSWWVAESDNVVSWTCSTSPYTNFTILIANSNPAILVAPFAFIAQQPNYDCSELITKDQVNQPPATGYTIQLADPFNNTNVYAESQPFEIKNLGSPYPSSSATPSSATASGSASASGSSPSSSAQGDSSKSGAGSLVAPGGLAAAAIAALGLILA